MTIDEANAHSEYPKRVLDRAMQRYEDLKQNRDAFLGRFGIDPDASIGDAERRAAVDSLAKEIVDEIGFASALAGEELPSGELLNDRFRIIEQIGNGAQGIAYIAHDQQDDREVVVKQLRLSHIDAWDAYDAFRREAEVMSQLDHPRLPHFIDLFHWHRGDDEYYFSAQTLLPGKNLEQRLTGGELFHENALISIASQCLEIMRHIHDNEPAVLHRDIKPSNVLLDDDGNVYLVDFGAVQYADSSKTVAVGTAGYMPPEQLVGKAVAPSDLYGLGATLVRLATRHDPQALPLKQMRLQWRDKASMTEQFANWIDNLISPDLENRYRDAATALKRLSSLGSVELNTGGTANPSYSLTPVEILHDKPRDCPVRLWESVDILVGTFPETTRNSGRVVFTKVDADYRSFLDRDAHSISKHGGGFSLDSKNAFGCSRTVDLQSSSNSDSTIRSKECSGYTKMDSTSLSPSTRGSLAKFTMSANVLFLLRIGRTGRTGSSPTSDGTR